MIEEPSPLRVNGALPMVRWLPAAAISAKDFAAVELRDDRLDLRFEGFVDPGSGPCGGQHRPDFRPASGRGRLRPR